MKRLVFAFVLIIYSLISWAISSPIASTIDEDHWHIPSIWCARGDVAGSCELIPEEGKAIVSIAVGAGADCYQYKPNQSGACTNQMLENSNINTKSQVNYLSGSYPSGFYKVMNVFVGENILKSLLTIRIFNIFIFAIMSGLVYWISGTQTRKALVWSLLITPIPFTYSILGSANPSTWSITGLALSPAIVICLMNIRKYDIGSRVLISILTAITAFLVLESRNDVSVYLGLVIPITLISLYSFKELYSKYRIQTLLFSLFSLLVIYREIATIRSFAVSGIGNENALGKLPDSQQENILANILEAPKTFLGTFGYFWGLGWNDLRMPQTVWLTGFAIFILFISAAISKAPRKRILGTVLVFLLTLIFPITVAVRGNFRVEGWLQPRYILPLIPVLIFIAAYRRGEEKQFYVSNNWIYAIAGLSTVVFAASLHLYLRRYLTGIDYWNWNLNSKVEWWWLTWPSPMLVWLLATMSFATGYVLVGKTLSRD